MTRPPPARRQRGQLGPGQHAGDGGGDQQVAGLDEEGQRGHDRDQRHGHEQAHRARAPPAPGSPGGQRPDRERQQPPPGEVGGEHPQVGADDARVSRRVVPGQRSQRRALGGEVPARRVGRVELTVPGLAVVAGHGVPGLDRPVLRLGRQLPAPAVGVEVGGVGHDAHRQRDGEGGEGPARGPPVRAQGHHEGQPQRHGQQQALGPGQVGQAQAQPGPGRERGRRHRGGPGPPGGRDHQGGGGQDEQGVLGLAARAPGRRGRRQPGGQRRHPGHGDARPLAPEPAAEEREGHDQHRAGQPGEDDRAGVRVGHDLAGPAQQRGDQGREVQLRVAPAGEAVALRQRHPRGEVGDFVGRGGVVGRPDGEAQGEAGQHGRAHRQPEPPPRRPPGRLDPRGGRGGLGLLRSRAWAGERRGPSHDERPYGPAVTPR